MSNYVKFTLQDFRSKLKSAGYSSLTGACRAAGKILKLTVEERDKAKAEARLYFKAVAKKQARRRKPRPLNVSFARKDGAPHPSSRADPRFQKAVPFVVTFYKASSDKNKREFLKSFLRSAVDEGQTLPTLLSLLEAV